MGRCCDGLEFFARLRRREPDRWSAGCRQSEPGSQPGANTSRLTAVTVAGRIGAATAAAAGHRAAADAMAELAGACAAAAVGKCGPAVPAVA